MIGIEDLLLGLDFRIQALLSGIFTWAVTGFGASLVLFVKNMPRKLSSIMLGFAGGVMTSASVFSLILPGLNSVNGEIPKWIPVTVGFILGVLLIRVIDFVLPHIHPGMSDEEREGLPINVRKSLLFFLAVTLHNIPEGLAIGVTYGASSIDPSNISLASAVGLSMGIGIQNFPEGMAVTFSFTGVGLSKKRAFLLGMISGVVEPIFAIVGVYGTVLLKSIMPYVMGFASGAMIYVVIEEIIPQSQYRGEQDASTLGYVGGFLSMMILDVALS